VDVETALAVVAAGLPLMVVWVALTGFVVRWAVGWAVRPLEKRLDRVDDRMDRLTDAVHSIDKHLTRVEDRLTGVEGRLTDVEGRLTDIEGRRTETVLQPLAVFAAGGPEGTPVLVPAPASVPAPVGETAAGTPTATGG